MKAVDGISFEIDRGSCVGLVGESGSGKSVTGLSIMRLVPPPGRIVSGKILLGKQDLTELSASQMQKVRGKKIAISFQDPMTYLNPVHRVGDQIAEAVVLHADVGKSEATEKAIRAIEKVRISDAAARAKDYPHQMSGGMRQRCLLAIALSCNPDLLIADEPTTSVDVVTQAAILRLLRDVKNETGLSVMLITHNLGIVAEFAQKIVIMYAGNIMEIGDVRSFFHRPYHPYTRALLESVPRLDRNSHTLTTIRGVICDPINKPHGCTFHPRCDFSEEICRREKPHMIEVTQGHLVACHQYG